MSAKAPVLHAIAMLRSGRPIRLTGASTLTVVPVETASGALLDLRNARERPRLLLSGARAAALNLANERDAADPGAPVLVEGAAWLDQLAAKSLADPAFDLERPPCGPLHAIATDDAATAEAAVTIARLAGLLPALWVLGENEADPTVLVEAVAAAKREQHVDVVSRAKLPIEGLPSTQIVAFRASDDGQEHVALLVGAFAGRPPLVRLHSECLTGDVFGSLKCDCGPQLKEALRIIGAEGGGVLLYMRQEGRGIGLANKVRAYALQDRGFDTVEANRRLGFGDDERDYGHAAAMLKALGIGRVRLLTNNPEKVHGLESAGIEVVGRVAHQMPPNPHNADYLATKHKKSGHLLG